MPKLSAGLLIHRNVEGATEVLLVHPGGPFWSRRDDGAWSLPKGEYGPNDDPLGAAIREFQEELGLDPPDEPPVFLGELRQPSGKRVSAWALEGDLDVRAVRSNTFTMEWPSGSGVMREFPEVDRAEWFGLEAARGKLLPGQVGFLDRLSEMLERMNEASQRPRTTDSRSPTKASPQADDASRRLGR